MKKVIKLSEEMKIYNKVMEFAKHKNPQGGFGNLYYMRTIKPDGTVTSETYGMNMMTEYGLTQYFYNSSKPSWPNYLYIGNGTDHTQSQINDNISSGSGHQLFSYFTTEHDVDSLRDTTIDYKYPMYYYKIRGSNPEDGIVTCVAKFRKCGFDYNITGVTQPFEITEYGIGTDSTHLWTHSWVYDKTGRYTYVTKTPGERLEMIIFLCMSYKTSVITNAIANGQYPVITTLQRFIGYRMDEQTFGTYCRYNSSTSRNSVSSTSYTPISGHQQTRTRYLTSFNISNSESAENGYIDGFYSYTPGFCVIEPQILTTPESFDIEIRDSFDNYYPTSISDQFGRKSTPQIPITQLTFDTSAEDGLWLYNRFHTINEDGYSNPISYTNESNYWYGEASLETSFNTPIYMTDINDTIIELFVYQNMHTDVPILQFNNTTIGTIYGTDAYWDKSKWVRIANPFAIPTAQQTCRYYITNSDSTSLNPVRALSKFTITPTAGENKTFSFTMYNLETQGCPQMSCENFENGFYVRNAYVFIPSLNTTYQIGVSGGKLSNATWTESTYQHMTYGKLIITTTNNSGGYFLLTSMDDLSSPATVQFITTGDNGFTATSNFNLGTLTYKTESGTGIFCFQRTDGNDECVVVDLTRRDVGSVNPYIKTKFDAKMSCAIYDTRSTTSSNHRQRIAYYTTDTTNPSIKIYDFDQETDILELNLPNVSGTNMTDIIIMWALNDHLYASNGSSWTWHWDLSSGNTSGESCTNIMTLFSAKSNLYKSRFTCVDDVIMIYNVEDVDITHVYYNRIDQHQNIVYSLKDFGFAQPNRTRSYYSLRYIENRNTLALICSYPWASGNYYGSTRVLIDFGQYLNPPTGYDPVYSKIYINTQSKYYNESPNFVPAWTTYGENVIWGQRQIPIVLMMPMRMKARTKTISAVNTIKHISGKTFDVTFTNSPPGEWSEDTPGYPPGVLN
jgi:hypothetical protein